MSCPAHAHKSKAMLPWLVTCHSSIALHTVALSARMFNFIQQKRTRRTQISDTGRLLRPRWVRLEARAGAVSTTSAEQPGSRDSADGSVQQPAMSRPRRTL
eukprot:1569770-Pyramimonas_sp.AAC.1